MKTRCNTSVLESLETRRLLASFASVNSNGTLSVVGTSKADTIVVQTSGSKVQAILNGATESFNASTVKRLWLEAFGGNDKITNKTSLQSTLIGDDGNDTIVGGSANDTIQDSSGNDQFNGGAGNDSIDSTSGSDTLIASAGNDSANFDHATVDFSAQKKIDFSFIGYGYYGVDMKSGLGEINLNQEHLDLHIVGSPGDDSFQGAAPDGTVIHGGDGNDYFHVWDANGVINPSLYGDAGNDTCFDDHDEGPVVFYGGSGNDLWQSSDLPPSLFADGGSGIDTVDMNTYDGYEYDFLSSTQTVPPNVEVFVGPHLGLKIIGNDLGNTIIGGSGNDTLMGEGGNDLLEGGGGNNSLSGNSGNDTLVGSTGSDTFQGGSGTDTADFSGRTDNLILHIDGQPDSGAPGEKDQIMGDVENIIGGSGNDLITGNPSNNSLEGGAGNDTIWGSSGNDTLVGDAGHDALYGQDGNDVLYGKDGQTDTLDGGNGTDKAARDNSSAVKDQVLNIESFL